MSQVLSIVASGMVSAVGLSAPASCAAIRCALDNFQETRFIDQGGEWLVGAPVMLPEPSSGYAQLVGMAAMAIAECVAGLPAEDIREMPLLLGVAEVDRPGRLAGLEQPLLQAIEERLGYRFHERSCVIPRGRVSAAVALLNARKLIEQGCSKVLIAGVDSYLTAATLAAYQERDRLLGSHCQDGFIPGEGAAAVLVTAACASEEPQLLCLGLGFGVEMHRRVRSDDRPRAAVHRPCRLTQGVCTRPAGTLSFGQRCWRTGRGGAWLPASEGELDGQRGLCQRPRALLQVGLGEIDSVVPRRLLHAASGTTDAVGRAGPLP